MYPLSFSSIGRSKPAIAELVLATTVAMGGTQNGSQIRVKAAAGKVSEAGVLTTVLHRCQLTHIDKVVVELMMQLVADQGYHRYVIAVSQSSLFRNGDSITMMSNISFFLLWSPDWLL